MQKMKKQRTEEKKGIDSMEELCIACRHDITKIKLEETFANSVKIFRLWEAVPVYWDNDLPIVFIEQILPQFVNLKVLDTAYCSIGDRGAIALAPVLRKLPSLVKLILWNNGLGPRSASALAPVFAEMSTLKHLNIGSNQWGDDGISTLAPALPRMRSLTYLCISKPPRMNETSRGNNALLSSLEKMRNLREIDVGDFFPFARRASRFSRHHQHLLTRLNKALRVPRYPVAEAIWAISCGFRSSFRAPNQYDLE